MISFQLQSPIVRADRHSHKILFLWGGGCPKAYSNVFFHNCQNIKQSGLSSWSPESSVCPVSWGCLPSFLGFFGPLFPEAKFEMWYCSEVKNVNISHWQEWLNLSDGKSASESRPLQWKMSFLKRHQIKSWEKWNEPLFHLEKFHLTISILYQMPSQNIAELPGYQSWSIWGGLLEAPFASYSCIILPSKAGQKGCAPTLKALKALHDSAKGWCEQPHGPIGPNIYGHYKDCFLDDNFMCFFFQQLL